MSKAEAVQVQDLRCGQEDAEPSWACSDRSPGSGDLYSVQPQSQ